MRKKLPLLALAFGLLVLVTAVFLNASTPFRGEHWSVIYAYSQAQGLDSFRNIFDFNCFGVTRFQFLSFFPLALSYSFFGLWFAGYLICAALLHVVYTYVFLRFLCLTDPPAERPKSVRGVFEKYPLEGALFLVIFFAADVVTWTFFLYLQLACVLAYAAVVRFWERRENTAQLAPFLLIGASAFLYEPFLLFIPAFLLISRRRCEWIWGGAIFGFFMALLYWRYTQYWNDLPNWSRGEVPPILSAPPFQKAVFAVAKYLGAVSVFFFRTFLPVAAEETNIYEIAIPGWFSILGLPVLAGVISLGALYSRRRRELSRFILAAATLAFLLIAWPRTENNLYLLKQFRYFYILAGLWVPLLLWRLRDMNKPKAYRVLLIGLIALHGLRGLEHSYRVQSAMRPLGEYIAMEKTLGMSSDAIVSNVADTLREGALPVAKRHFPLLYNASSCLREWNEKLKK